jgi:hypothetical protein
MTFAEILDSLPNGLHDASLSSLKVDYLNRLIRLRLKIWTGNLESNLVEEREEYKDADLRIVQFTNCIVEPPGYSRGVQPQEVKIDAGMFPDEKLAAPDQIFRNTDPNDEQYWLFLNDLNSFIYISAQGAELLWNEESAQQEAAWDKPMS